MAFFQLPFVRNFLTFFLIEFTNRETDELGHQKSFFFFLLILFYFILNFYLLLLWVC